MSKRVAVIGGVLAVVLATAVVVIIFNDCRHNDREDDCPEDWEFANGMAPVLVSTQDIQAGQAMDSVIEAEPLMEIQVTNDALIEGAVTDAWQLEGRTTTRPIGKGEQISVHYLSERRRSERLADRTIFRADPRQVARRSVTL